MFKFKEGDKVRMNSFEEIKTNKTDRWIIINSYMEKLVGEEGIILHAEDYHGILRYYINEGSGWYWPESSLTLVEAKDTCQIKPGDKVNACIDNVRWSLSDGIFYVGMDRRGKYVVENKDGDLSSWEYCRPFKEKITYNVWEYKDTKEDFHVLREGKLPIACLNWKIIHTFTI